MFVVCLLQDFRQRLPSWKAKEELLELIKGSQQVSVISGETGCGKTTQVRERGVGEGGREGWVGGGGGGEGGKEGGGWEWGEGGREGGAGCEYEAILAGDCDILTQVPQFILDDAIMNGWGSRCHIICTQPRRISAISGTVSTNLFLGMTLYLLEISEMVSI